MPRIRSVHPGFFTDEVFVTLATETQLFMIGLWTQADDQGVFEWKPVTLSMRLRPTRAESSEALLEQLLAAGCIRDFSVDGRRYGAIRNFRKFQRPRSPVITHPVTHEIARYVGLTQNVQQAQSEPGQAAQNAEADPQREEERREGDIQMSGAPDLYVPEGSRAKKSYPPAFEAFWRDYPTDPLMSKSCAFAKWQQLMPLDQAAAHAAITSFKNYCARNPTYRPVHAERFLSQRRFDGFAVTRAPTDPILMRGLWDGAACQLVDAIGPDLFKAHFGDVVFEDGPPVTFYAATPFRRDIIMEKFASHIRRIFGEEASVEVKPKMPGQEKAQ